MTTPPPSWPPPRPSDPAEIAGLPTPRIWRSRTDRVLAGVLGGLAERFGWEARPVRILYGLLTIASMGVLVVPYVGLWAITRPYGPASPAPRLRRSPTNRVIAGVLGGIAEKLGLAPTGVRIAYVLLSALSAGFPGILLYLLLWAFVRPAADPPLPRR